MGFHWRAAKDKFKGEGVYFLTFVVKDRRPLLGELVPIPQPDVARQKDTDVYNKSSEMGTAEGPGGNPDLYTSHLARVKPTELGFRISEDIKNISKRYPGGAYHHASGEGRLLLLAVYPENYENSKLIELTEEELKRKAVEKGLTYHPIPHDSKRWRMIAGNMMLQMVAQEPR